jgi:regulator of protease activity HflC (stomatin/prohibitin superfamily)
MIEGAGPRRGNPKVGLVFVGLTLLVVLLYASITVVPAGCVGVVDLFGSVSDDFVRAGMHLLNPLARVIIFSIKTQIITMSEDVPSKEGLSIHLEAAALFHLDPNRAVAMYREVGEHYVDTVVLPQFRSVLRSVTSAHDAKDLYSATARISMTAALKAELVELLQPRGLVVESTPLKNLLLPEALQNAIQEKLRAEQESQKMEFVLQKEEREAQRKVIEAKGIQEFQDIVRKGIDEHLLRWKGIEATERLANSHNSKLIFIGSGSVGGLPVMLNPPDFPVANDNPHVHSSAESKRFKTHKVVTDDDDLHYLQDS